MQNLVVTDDSGNRVPTAAFTGDHWKQENGGGGPRLAALAAIALVNH
jgi:hypothetical protein